jgi:hypothetical protein
MVPQQLVWRFCKRYKVINVATFLNWKLEIKDNPECIKGMNILFNDFNGTVEITIRVLILL